MFKLHSLLTLLVAVAYLVAGDDAASRAAEPVRLTTDGRLKRDPVIWPDGEHITYTTVTDAGISRLMRLSLVDGSIELLHPDESIPERELTVSADGTVYAYVNVLPNGQGSSVVVRDSKRSGPLTLTPPNFALWPTLSPDGNRIVFTVNAGPMVSCDLRRIRSADQPVKITAETGSGVERLSDVGASYGDLWPRYSPTGQYIAFSSRRDDDFEIYLLNADGGAQLRLTHSPGIDAHPAFTADGKQVVFTSNRDGNYEIYVMRLDGSNPRRVTTNPERDDYPYCHPDGKRLLMVSERKGRFDLYLMDLPQ